ncbi:plasmid pRiA4b ORF-3 family protein [Candidatus Dependentiae bacterium]|nr:plasmid pRiA4b ORF-3 family protein [Candidatus Dependentiae bacterium]
MVTKEKQVYQFKITLTRIKPVIWRRIQVQERYTFWELHCAIQDSMGWTDSHLHMFNIKNPNTGNKENIGIYKDEYSPPNMLFDWMEYIKNWFTMENNTAIYEYDFGDFWEHIIELEKILPAIPKQKYPVCIGGENACPPEDVGGIGGYEEFVKIIYDFQHPERPEYLQWVGGRFIPTEFNSTSIKFTKPGHRLNRLFD